MTRADLSIAQFGYHIRGYWQVTMALLRYGIRLFCTVLPTKSISYTDVCRLTARPASTSLQ